MKTRTFVTEYLPRSWQLFSDLIIVYWPYQ